MAYFKLIQKAARIESVLKEVLKPYELTHPQLNILSILFKNKNKSFSASEIKAQLIVHSPDLTRLVDRLCKKSLVSRITDSQNRRRVCIQITVQGSELYKKAHYAAKTRMQNYFQTQITEAEAASLSSILDKLVL